jgi:hypothetical protein
MCGKAVVEVFTAQESAAAISGSASPMPVRTLKMVHDVTVLQWTRLVSDKVVGSTKSTVSREKRLVDMPVGCSRLI